VVPIPLVIWGKNQHNINRQPIETKKIYCTNKETKVKQTCILPITKDYLCPFLKDDLSCAIYNDRPDVCRKYGDESHPMLCCPMQHADGTERSEEEISKRLIE
jgi:Fe-S-cluster containining protein